MKEINTEVKQLFQMNGSVGRVFFKKFQQEYELPDGLNKTHVKTIMMLNILGSVPMSTLSKMTLLEKGSFTPVANKLVKEEYIIKEQSEKDKRIYNLVLTKKGKKFAEDLGTAHMAYVEGIISQFDEDEKEEYFQAIRTINRITAKLMDDDCCAELNK